MEGFPTKSPSIHNLAVNRGRLYATLEGVHVFDCASGNLVFRRSWTGLGFMRFYRTNPHCTLALGGMASTVLNSPGCKRMGRRSRHGQP